MDKINFFNILSINLILSYFLGYDYDNNKNYIYLLCTAILILFCLYIFLYSLRIKSILSFFLFSVIGLLIYFADLSINNKKLNHYAYDIVSYLKFQKKVLFNKENSLNNIIAYENSDVKNFYLLFSIDDDINLYKYKNGKISIQDENNFIGHKIFSHVKDGQKYYFSTFNSQIATKDKHNKIISRNIKFHHWPHITETNIFIPVFDYSLKKKKNFNLFADLAKSSQNLKYCDFEFNNLPVIDAVEIFDKNLVKIDKFTYIFKFLKDKNIKNKLSNKRCDDFLHLNFIYELKNKDTRKIPGSSEGDLLLTFRSFDGVILINPKNHNIIYDYQIIKSKPHSGFINFNGNLVLLDNTSKKNTRVVEIDPLSKVIIGEFFNEKLQTETRGLIYEVGINKYVILYNSVGKIIYLNCENNINNQCKHSILVDSYNQISGVSVNY